MEEGIAIASEKMVTDDLEKLDMTPTVHHITTFIAEQHTTVETEELLTVYYTLLGHVSPSDEAKKRTKRVKKFSSHLLPGAKRKDVVYTRGYRTIVSQLHEMETNDIAQLLPYAYVSKIGFSDLSEIDFDEIRQEFSVNKEEVKVPLWIGQVMYRKIMGIESNPLQVANAYLTYTQKREMIASGKNNLKHEMIELLSFPYPLETEE